MGEMVRKAIFLFCALMLWGIFLSPAGWTEEGKPSITAESNQSKGDIKYPPYPDVWERELLYFPYKMNIVPAINGDVILDINLVVDRNLDRSKNKEEYTRNSSMFFFSGEKVYKRLEKAYGEYKSYTFSDENIYKHFFSFKEGFFRETQTSSVFYLEPGVAKSKDVSLSDGSLIRWVYGVAFNYHKYYEGAQAGKETRIDGVIVKPNDEGLGEKFQSYNLIEANSLEMKQSNVFVLTRRTSQGEILWRKVYFYFDPWWLRVYHRSEDDTFLFSTLRNGCISLIDQERMFLHFEGVKTIFRFDKNGDLHTRNPNIIAMDYDEYREYLQFYMEKLIAWRRTNLSPKNDWANYDHFSVLLARKKGKDVGSELVKGVMRKRDIQETEEWYRKFEKTINWE